MIKKFKLQKKKSAPLKIKDKVVIDNNTTIGHVSQLKEITVIYRSSTEPKNILTKFPYV